MSLGSLGPFSTVLGSIMRVLLFSSLRGGQGEINVQGRVSKAVRARQQLTSYADIL